MGSGTKQRTVGVVGDDHNDETLLGRTHKIDEHFHSIDMVIPSLGDGVLVTSKNIIWTLGDDFAIVAATNAITDPFDIHWINIEDASANGVYEIVLYSGADASEIVIARKRFVREAARVATTGIGMITPMIPANTQIKAKLASDGVAADTANISVDYHVY